MAEAQNNAVVGYPTREIRITGERVAQMLHTVIQVSRFEQKLIDLTMKGRRESRPLVKSASERFSRALNSLEDELKEAERELAMAARASDRPSKPARKKSPGQNGQAVRTPNTPPAAKQGSQTSPQTRPATASPATNAAEQPAQRIAPKPTDAERTQQPVGQGGKQKAQSGKGQHAGENGTNGGQTPKPKEAKPQGQKPGGNRDQGKDQPKNDRSHDSQVASTATEAGALQDSAPIPHDAAAVL